MLFTINPRTGGLERLRSDWAPKELELESYLVNKTEEGLPVLSEAVFGEPLLLLTNQVRTHANKRADILALDRAGNGVIIELKRSTGRLGVETQALQYLADFSHYRGRNFLKKFSKLSEETVMGFLGNEAKLEELNTASRVILMARSFDETIFSLGEWLSSKGVAFRCISYTPVEHGGAQLLSFSVAFDRSSAALFRLSFGSATREPAIYWHNIAKADQSWWTFLRDQNQIPTGFDNLPGDEGERILRRYVAGDCVVAYAKGYGALGWGRVEDPQTYRLIAPGSPGDVLGGLCRHRLSVRWQAAAKVLSDALPADRVRRDFGIHHPLSTSVSMDPVAGRRLTERLSALFSQGASPNQRRRA